MSSKNKRNSLCSCGSGKKFKHCCLGRNDSTVVAQANVANDLPSIQQRLSAAIFAHGQGEAATAEAIYREVLDIMPDNPEALHYLGVCHQQRGELAEAERLMQQSVSLAPNNPTFLSNLGNILKGNDNLPAARAAYLQALALKPDFIDALNNLGNCHLAENSAELAIQAFESALKLGGENPRLLNNLGMAYFSANRLDNAEGCFKRSLTAQPINPVALFQLGLLAKQLNQLERAIDYFSKACEIAPQYAEAWNGLGACYVSARRYAEAVEPLQRAIGLRSNFGEAYNNLGGTFRGLGRLSEAINAFETAISINEAFAKNRHLIAAMQGEGTDRPPEEYVRDLFDSYAEKFDTHLTGELAYQIPKQLRALLNSDAPQDPKSLSILDLGCGTGLAGLAFQELAHTLMGVDLSQKMLDKARERGIYDQLVQGDLLTTAEALADESINVAIAADVLVYLGKLESLFITLSRKLRPGGSFLFSVEAIENTTALQADYPSAIPEFQLDSSGRYQHSSHYLKRLAADSGFMCIKIDSATVRLERGNPIPAWIGHFQKR